MTVSRLLFQRIGYKRLPPRVNHFASEAPNGRDERRRTLITARRVGYQGSTQLHPVVRKALRAERIHGGSKAYPGRSSGAERRRNGQAHRRVLFARPVQRLVSWSDY
jgi:hypothetical protein